MTLLKGWRARARTAAAAMAMGAIVVGSLGAPATALPTDQSEAEGRLLSGGGTINLNAIAALDPAYSADPSATGEVKHPLDADVLSALNIDLGDGVQLFGENPVLAVGALDQYANTSPATPPFASSGLIGDDGAIAVAPAGANGDAYVNLTPLLEQAGLNELISALRLDLGAVSASATVDENGAFVGDYQVANGKLTLKSPAVDGLTGELNTTAGTLSDTLNEIAGEGGTIDAALDPTLSTLEETLNTALLGLGTVDDLAVTATMDVDLQDALASVLSQKITSDDSAVSIDFSTGEIIIDIAKLIADSQGGTYDGTLNGLDPNTEILEPGLIQAALDGAIGSIADQVTDLLVTAVTDAVNSTDVTINITGEVTALEVIPGVPGLPIGNLDINVEGTLGGLIGASGSEAPEVNFDGTDVVGLDVGAILTPILGDITEAILPALVTPISDAITDAGALDTVFRPVVEAAVEVLSPLFTQINENLLSVIVNVQEEPGEFTTEGADSTGSFTERAVKLTLLPSLVPPAAEISLASATVRGVVEDDDSNANASSSAAASATADDDSNASADVAAQAAANADATSAASAASDADATAAAQAAANADASSDASSDVSTDANSAATAAAQAAADADANDATNADASAAADQEANADSDSSAASAAEAASTADSSTDASVEASATSDADASADPNAAATDDASADVNANAASAAAASANADDDSNASAEAAAQAAANADATDAASAAADADANAAAQAAATADASSDASSDATSEANAASAAAAQAAADADANDATNADASAAADVEANADSDSAAAAAAEAASTADSSSDASAEASATSDADASADPNADATDDASADVNANAASAAAASANADDDSNAASEAAAQAAANADATSAASAAADADANVAAQAAATADASSDASTDATSEANAASAAAAQAAANADATDASNADSSAAADANAAAASEAASTANSSADASAEAAASSDAAADGQGDLFATIKYELIARGTGIVQEVYGTGFAAGESVTATVNSDPFDITAVANEQGNVTFTFPVGNDFDLGDHVVLLVGATSGAVPEANSQTNFVVVSANTDADSSSSSDAVGNADASAASSANANVSSSANASASADSDDNAGSNGGGGDLADTGAGFGLGLPIGAALLILLGGSALTIARIRRKSSV